MRLSAIEIGTNSTKFIIAEPVENDLFKIIHKTSTNNRLSSGMYPDRRLSSEAITRGVEIIRKYVAESESREAQLIGVFSTSVLRDALNKTDFLGAVKTALGIDVKIISGEYEAVLTHLACSRAAGDKGSIFCSIDIGGGSTEFSLGDSRKIGNKFSLNIGAVRLSEMFIANDPVLKSEVDEIIGLVLSKMQEQGLDVSGMALIGTGGTVKSLATIFLCTDYRDEEKIDGITLDRLDVERMWEFLLKLTIEEKKILLGLNPKRADVIVAGATILVTVMRKFNIKEITVSAQGVIEGFIMDYLGHRKGGLYVID